MAKLIYGGGDARKASEALETWHTGIELVYASCLLTWPYTNEPRGEIIALLQMSYVAYGEHARLGWANEAIAWLDGDTVSTLPWHEPLEEARLIYLRTAFLGEE